MAIATKLQRSASWKFNLGIQWVVRRGKLDLESCKQLRAVGKCMEFGSVLSAEL